MVPFNGVTATNVRINNGVYSVTISDTIKGANDTLIVDSVTAALKNDLGDLPSQFDHIMICLPPCTAGSWVGYGT